MNTLKFKSVAVRLSTYQQLQKLAQLNNRSAGMQITELVDKAMKRKKKAA
jgi:hypothetical protein|tara:strand:- start:2863 stop:3012 length:150 start_codon:yes stop_codon:yes gene_type:complete